jgi:uncharacterized protein (DUF3084 family)
MVDLTQIKLATDEDKDYRTDYWARLFKATTWEEIKMIAKNDQNLLEASETLYSLNADKTIRDQCEARADYDRLHNTINLKMAELTADKEKLTAEKQALTSQNNELTSQNTKLASQNTKLASQNGELTVQNELLKKILAENGISYQ